MCNHEWELSFFFHEGDRVPVFGSFVEKLNWADLWNSYIEIAFNWDDILLHVLPILYIAIVNKSNCGSLSLKKVKYSACVIKSQKIAL